MKTKTKKPTGFDRDEDTAAIVSLLFSVPRRPDVPARRGIPPAMARTNGRLPSRALIRRCLRMARELDAPALR